MVTITGKGANPNYRKSRHLGKNGFICWSPKGSWKLKNQREWCWLSQVNTPCIGSLLEGITRLRVFQNCWKISKTPRIGCLMYIYIHGFVKCWVTNWYYIVKKYVKLYTYRFWDTYIPPIQYFFLVFFSGSKLGFCSYCGSWTIENHPSLSLACGFHNPFGAFCRHPLCRFL